MATVAEMEGGQTRNLVFGGSTPHLAQVLIIFASILLRIIDNFLAYIAASLVASVGNLSRALG